MRKIWKALVGAEKFAQEMFPELRNPRYPNLPEELTFLHAEELLAMYPALPRKRRETVILQKYPAVFIIGIGWPLKDGYPHEMRAADYDDWITDTSSQTNRDTHGVITREPDARKRARPVRAGGRWQRTHTNGHLANGLPVPRLLPGYRWARREDTVRLGPKRPPVAAGWERGIRVR